MTTLTPIPAPQLRSETVKALYQLIQGLNDVIGFHNECLSVNADPKFQATVHPIVKERTEIRTIISSLAARHGSPGSQKFVRPASQWLSTSARLRPADGNAFLKQAVRFEESVVQDFRRVLQETACYSTNAKLLEYFELVKRGRDQILALRDDCPRK